MPQADRETAPPAPADAGGPGETPAGGARGYARMRAKEDAARAELEPLAEGERPAAVKVAVAMAAGIGIANIALQLGGWQLRDAAQPKPGQGLLLPVFMLVLAVGMWQLRYWALLTFQAVLGISILFAFLFLLRASNLQAVLLCLGLVAVFGTLFWFLVRAMARVQMPRDPSR